MGKKRKFEVEQKDTNEFGLPAKFLATSHIRSQEKRLIIILEGAQLETVKVGPSFKMIHFCSHLSNKHVFTMWFLR